MRSNWITANLTRADKTLRLTRFWQKSNLITQALVWAMLISAVCSSLAYADDVSTVQDSSPIDWSFSLTSEFADDLNGGMEQGGTTNHLARLELFIDAAKLGLSTGSRFKVTLQGIRSGKLSEDLVGDAQGASNLEASSRDQLYELWYGQKLGKSWDFRAGLIPADNYFDDVDSGALLINSSFGVEPIWSGNTVAAIYPTAGIGAMATWQSGAWIERFGIFQDDPNDRSSAFNRGEVLMQELVYQGKRIYKWGLSSSHPSAPESVGLPPSNWSSYFSVDEPLEQGDSVPHVFLRVGISPQHKSAVRNDVETGTLLTGLFDSRPLDQFSFGIARTSLRGLGSETAYELTYQYFISHYVSLQPDIQYIDKPSNTYSAATVAILRLNITI